MEWVIKQSLVVVRSAQPVDKHTHIQHTLYQLCMNTLSMIIVLQSNQDNPLSSYTTTQFIGNISSSFISEYFPTEKMPLCFIICGVGKWGPSPTGWIRLVWLGLAVLDLAQISDIGLAQVGCIWLGSGLVDLLRLVILDLFRSVVLDLLRLVSLYLFELVAFDLFMLIASEPLQLGVCDLYDLVTWD